MGNEMERIEKQKNKLETLIVKENGLDVLMGDLWQELLLRT